jgi:hypothetical protein
MGKTEKRRLRNNLFQIYFFSTPSVKAIRFFLDDFRRTGVAHYSPTPIYDANSKHTSPKTTIAAR